MLQAQLQQLSQQVNQQVSMYTNRGFDIKDVSSGMTHATGKHYRIAITPCFESLSRTDSPTAFCSATLPKTAVQSFAIKLRAT